jgi:hypothetical protein
MTEKNWELQYVTEHALRLAEKRRLERITVTATLVAAVTAGLSGFGLAALFYRRATR